MKKILILLPDLSGGGAERLHINLANYWHTKGINVVFALMSRRGDLIGSLPRHFKIIDLNAFRIRQVIFPLAYYLRKIRPDIVIAAMWPLTSAAVFAWCLAGRPGRLFLSDHTQLSISSIHEINFPAWLVGFAIRLSYPFASGIIAVSEGVKNDMSNISGIELSKIKVIYNPSALGVSASRESNKVKCKLWGDGFDYHILAVGNLKTQKDHITLIKAFFKLQSRVNAKLVILGEGYLRPKLEALVEQLGLQDRIIMPGFVVDPYPWYRSADLFVLSSRWEGFGNVIVEALECGVSVVSTDCPSGPAEILDNGRIGRLVPIQDPDALAECIEQSLIHPVDRNVLIRRANDFSVCTIAEQYLTYFGLSEKLECNN